MKILASVVGLLLIGTMPATADPDQYRPHVSGAPAGTMVGTLVQYGQGMQAGSIEIRVASGKVVKFFTAAPPTRINGRTVDCILPPMPPSYRRNPFMCERWPAGVRIGLTRVRVPYWKGRLEGERVLIARDLNVIR